MAAQSLHELPADAQVGLSDVIGSWKIIADSRAPRRAARAPRAAREVAALERCPVDVARRRRTSRRIERQVALLPQPDSPTSPKNSPSYIERNAIDGAHRAPHRAP